MGRKAMVINMEYENLSKLISYDVEARKYFNSLSAKEQQIILDRGPGVNTLQKLKEFAYMTENNMLS